jgi:hypothetical protein
MKGERPMTDRATNKVSDAELTAFMLMAQERTGLRLGYDIGQRYARIFHHDDDHHYGSGCTRVVFGFIDLTNGNVLRAEGWKRPNLTIKNPIQGNVFDEDKGSNAISGSRVYRKP